MSIISHIKGECKQEIEALKIHLANSQAQSLSYMRDLTEVTCKLRTAIMSKQKDCSDCKEPKPITVIVEKIKDSVVE